MGACASVGQSVHPLRSPPPCAVPSSPEPARRAQAASSNAEVEALLRQGVVVTHPKEVTVADTATTTGYALAPYHHPRRVVVAAEGEEALVEGEEGSSQQAVQQAALPLGSGGESTMEPLLTSIPTVYHTEQLQPSPTAGTSAQATGSPAEDSSALELSGSEDKVATA
jgi:hypothetical protein